MAPTNRRQNLHFAAKATSATLATATLTNIITTTPSALALVPSDLTTLNAISAAALANVTAAESYTSSTPSTPLASIVPSTAQRMALAQHRQHGKRERPG